MQVVKNPSADSGDEKVEGLIPGSGRSPGERNGNPLQYFLPGESHEQRSLEGYSLWVTESDMTKYMHTGPDRHARYVLIKKQFLLKEPLV